MLRSLSAALTDNRLRCNQPRSSQRHLLERFHMSFQANTILRGLQQPEMFRGFRKHRGRSPTWLERASETAMSPGCAHRTRPVLRAHTYLCTVKVLVFFEQFIRLLDCHFIIAIIEIICIGRTYTALQQSRGPLWKVASHCWEASSTNLIFLGQSPLSHTFRKRVAL